MNILSSILLVSFVAIGMVVVNLIALIIYGIKAMLNKSSIDKREKLYLNSLPEYQEHYTGVHNGQAYVDLGLPSGMLWAIYNIGAYHPNEIGHYFMWGSTTPYQGANYNKLIYIIPTLDSQHDAACTHWAGSWRTPTKAEYEELINGCKHVMAKCQGTIGILFIGPNGNSLFLPLTGYISCGQNKLRDTDIMGYYWTSQQDNEATGVAYALDFYRNIDKMKVGTELKNNGIPIRPVLILNSPR